MAAAKRNNDYIIENIDKAINELVYNKFKMQKAYNYYNGRRDPEQFRYLEENFGIGNPTSVEFTPLVKKHVDALIGEYLDIPMMPKISCKDKSTISYIDRDKQIAISKAIFDYYKLKLNNDTLQFLNGQKNPQVEDTAIKKELDKLVEDIDNNFVSEYEKAAQAVLEYVIQSRNTDLDTRKRELMTDLLVGGQAYYQVKSSPEGTNIDIEVLDPLNTFVDKNPDSQYVKDSYRVVIRRWMTKQQILNKYGSELTREAINELEDMHDHYSDTNYMYIRSRSGELSLGYSEGDMADLDSGKTVIPGYPSNTYESFNYKWLPVYEVEWIDVDKQEGVYVENRYEGVRIGQSIYIPRGKSENIIRSQDALTKCKLSVGGIFLINRDHRPTSLILQCAHLQDKYDVVTFLRDNILANSGTMGDWLDVSMLPQFLGSDMTERLIKWQSYKKAGLALMDSSQEGRGFNNNTFTSGYDDAAKVQTMQAFEVVLERIENQVSSITGVFRERLNGITQRDAVSNVEAGARNSFTITKPFYQQMDMLVIDILGDCLDIAKIVWKNGLTGTIILGDKLQRIFTALPEHFTHTDYDIHIVPSTRILKDMQNMQNIIVELIKGGLMDPDMATEALTSRSLTELKDIISKSWAKKKAENNQIQQLGQQLQEAQNQIQQLNQQNQQLQSKIQSLDEQRIQLEREKLQVESDIKWFQARTDRAYKNDSIDVDRQKVKIELAQISDGNPYNDEIRY